MLIIKLSEGLAGRNLNQSLQSDLSLVLASTALHCSLVTVKTILLESSANHNNLRLDRKGCIDQ